MPDRQDFPRAERLTRRREYQYVYQHGVKRVGRGFIVFTVRRPEEGRKLGRAVSRKVGNAVVRNRVRRYIREVYRRHKSAWPGDLQMVVVARPASAAWTCQQCEAELLRLLSEGGRAHG